MAYLDKTGLTYFWSKVKAQLGNKSDKGHTHSYNELNDKPTIPTIPSSLPANGGNADTVDGYHIVKTTDENSTGQTGCITFIV